MEKNKAKSAVIEASKLQINELEETVQGRRVGMAVSGGADSLLSMILLKESGAEVVAFHGIFIGPEKSAKAIEGLTRRCNEIGIEFHSLDMVADFEHKVVETFVNDYLSGKTPNPCAACNPAIKFGALFDAVARECGASMLGTGHYARMAEHSEYGRVLVRGIDAGKDQSYFLSLVSRERLHRAVFPLGNMKKDTVYRELEKRGLEIPLSSESQEICFVPDDDYRLFIRNRDVELPAGGNAVLADGTVVGRHHGLWQYTQGQRRGLGISWSEPLYVIEKNLERNELIVGPRADLDSGGCIAADANILVDPELWPEEVMLQTRYRQKAKPSRVTVDGGSLNFEFLQPHSRPTPGQIAAVYSPEGAVLAGGVIERPLDG